MKKPLIINLEGIDGTGKSSVSQYLRETLESKHNKVLNLHFPLYGTPTGDLVKLFLNGGLGIDPTQTDPIQASLYYTADRLTYFHNNSIIFTDYDILLFDRSYMSNFFFQTAKYSTASSVEWLNNIVRYISTMYTLEIENTPLVSFIDRIHTFYLYHSKIETNIEMMQKRGEALDLHESNISYLQNINQNANMIYANREIIQKKLLPEESMAYDFTKIKCSYNERGRTDLRPIEIIGTEILSCI